MLWGLFKLTDTASLVERTEVERERFGLGGRGGEGV